MELITPQARVFRGTASAVELWCANAVVQMESDVTAYFGLIQAAEVMVRVGNRHRFFTVLNASASIRDRQFRVIAEVIRPTAPPEGN